MKKIYFLKMIGMINVNEIKKENSWDDDIFDYCIKALSKLYNVNVHIFNIDELPNSGYEFINNILQESQERSNNDIYLRRTNNNHYDLMEEIIP